VTERGSRTMPRPIPRSCGIPGASAIVPLVTPEEVPLIRQFRYAAGVSSPRSPPAPERGGRLSPRAARGGEEPGTAPGGSSSSARSSPPPASPTR
jgi:hypothetical protein